MDILSPEFYTLSEKQITLVILAAGTPGIIWLKGATDNLLQIFWSPAAAEELVTIATTPSGPRAYARKFGFQRYDNGQEADEIVNAAIAKFRPEDQTAEASR